MPWEFMQINYSVVVLEKIFPTYSNINLGSPITFPTKVPGNGFLTALSLHPLSEDACTSSVMTLAVVLWIRFFFVHLH